MYFWCRTCRKIIPEEEINIGEYFEEYHELCGTCIGHDVELTKEEIIQSCIDYLIDCGFTPEDYEKEFKKCLTE